jgi:hypothetical protein
MTNKILVFSGCSFVAGDDIAWDYSKGPYPNDIYNWEKNKEYFTIIRPNNNLPAFTQEFTNAPNKVDLSRDGNNNSDIALAVINYLNRLSPLDRKNFHICVGWTEPARTCKWSNIHSQFVSLCPWMADFENSVAKDSEYHKILNEETKHYAKAFFNNFYDADMLLDYTKNILMLESYLKSQGVTYTFWRSLGWVENRHEISKLNRCIIDTKTFTDETRWIRFTNESLDLSPSFAESVYFLMSREPEKYVTKGIHPNRAAAKVIAEKIANTII